MLLKQHLDMIGRNEPIQRKAKFWQSYVRALKGTDDMRAPEHTHYSRYPSRGIFQPLLDDIPTWPKSKSIYDDPIAPSERISVPGYRYLPISRETYGISPRNIYPHNYVDYNRYPRNPTDVFAKGPYHAQNEWDAHLDRLAQIESLYPEKYPSPATYRPKTPTLESHFPKRAWSPAPKAPSEKAVAFNYAGQPIYTRGGFSRRPLSELLEPLVSMPISRITRDPWWHEYPELRPFDSPYSYACKSPFYLRNSYLSPVKRTYLWREHPIRPFTSHRVWY
ncbi:unnamed protein product [Bemisia tabaci]|uniref:Myofilin n=1 Tax=Bemisia tabaci TaxID=7038 RepID=A0A9P0A7T8_BEMTA|nr:unnamed protein product [Bemisia tabaci]